MRETERVLTQAREINPLNTDHSANLARMYRRWADTALDAEMRPSLLRRSAENYAIATSLSRQNVILWNEWAMLYYYGLGDVAAYGRTLQHSLELDPGFDQTWLMCGDINRQEGRLEEAAQCYEEALELTPGIPQVWRVVGDTYMALQRWEDAIDALTQALVLQPDSEDAWNVHNVLARLYSQVGQQEQALVHASTALQLAPEDQQSMLQDLIAQLQSLETLQP
jgi:tetratricopeptide (TPR) repeat protein